MVSFYVTYVLVKSRTRPQRRYVRVVAGSSSLSPAYTIDKLSRVTMISSDPPGDHSRTANAKHENELQREQQPMHSNIFAIYYE